MRETVQEVFVQRTVEKQASKKAPLSAIPESELLACGVPPEWIADLRSADEDALLRLVEHLPAEAAEAVLDLATGSKPKPVPVVAPGGDPFQHPDAQRRFRLMRNPDELERALDYPWDKWIVFLHPAQRQLVERDFNGPARVAGSAGTGKTIVAIHRAVALARKHTDARILLTTFSETLANALRGKLVRLIGNEPRLAERIEVHSMDAIGCRLYRAHFGVTPRIASPDLMRAVITESSAAIPGHKFTERFLLSEWADIADAWQIDSWEKYREVPRLGRKTRLPETQRTTLWQIFSAVRGNLERQGLITEAGMFAQVASKLATEPPPFDFAVIDEAQDVSVQQLRFLAALGRSRPDALFFAGDLGQRIFRQPFSWKALGVDIRGRSATLKVVYRTSHQIREQADRLLGPSVADVDGNIEERKGTTSVFNGPPPVIRGFESQKAEIAAVAVWMNERVSKDAIPPGEIGVFVRSSAELDRAKHAVTEAGLKSQVLDETVSCAPGHVAIGTMHLAKGLEFRAVAVIACDDEIIPSQDRIETAGDESDLEEIYVTERHLLYVACTRARDHLLVSGVKPVSEFLDDLAGPVTTPARRRS